MVSRQEAKNTKNGAGQNIGCIKQRLFSEFWSKKEVAVSICVGLNPRGRQAGQRRARESLGGWLCRAVSPRPVSCRAPFRMALLSVAGRKGLGSATVASVSGGLSPFNMQTYHVNFQVGTMKSRVFHTFPPWQAC